MPADTPSLATLIREAIESRLVDVHTSIPARVQTYDAGAQTADVRPELRRVVRRADGTRASEDLPVIPCVPVQFLSAGDFFFAVPVGPGTTGLLVFTEYSIDRWRSGDSLVDPGDERRHGLSGAVFVPGLRSSSAPLADVDGTNLRFGKSGGYVVEVTDSEIRMPNDATNFLARADRVLSELSAIVNAYNLHTHTGVTAGVGTSGGPSAPIPAPSSPASDTVKGT